MKGENDTKQLRAQRKIDYYEEFSDGDQDDYVNDNTETLLRRKYNRAPTRKCIQAMSCNAKQASTMNKGKLFKKESQACSLKEIAGHTQSKNTTRKSKLTEMIINLDELNNKEVVTNSDMMLCLLEICLNSKRHDIFIDNRSRSFWSIISQKDNLFHSLRNFKPETLRKYWRKIRLTNKYEKMIEILRSSQDKINDANFKFFSAINVICDYALNPERGLDHYIKKYTKKPIINNIINSKTVNAKTDKTGYKKTNDEEDNQSSNGETMDNIARMVELLAKCFPNETKAFLYQKLIDLNGNVENAYLYIKDPEHYKYLMFTKEEDDLIKESNTNSNNEDSEQYKLLLKKKGFLLINQRREFLTA